MSALRPTFTRLTSSLRPSLTSALRPTLTPTQSPILIQSRSVNAHVGAGLKEITIVKDNFRISLELRKEANKYLNMSQKHKSAFVPPARGSITDPTSFLTAIGRDCVTVADKFPDWDSIFTMTSKAMNEAGIKPPMRKYILSWREWYRRGAEPYEVKIRPRQQHYKKARAIIDLARKRRAGLA
ncbi:hypothetical protein HK097_001121 [Rhizophlyctis rosea]|uniref:Small ribosomal subunit protein mS41 n=1 Tax=Rhizophlyctis rosea TaxID=64517 RepID=A0AAD5S4R9_9FUNG|nr:hypothetical protein HK097_001121 [Rhizophlyctis rosea]